MSSNGHVQKGAPTRKWLNQNVAPAVLEGMRFITRTRPEDPVKALGEFLLSYKPQEESTIETKVALSAQQADQQPDPEPNTTVKQDPEVKQAPEVVPVPVVRAPALPLSALLASEPSTTELASQPKEALAAAPAAPVNNTSPTENVASVPASNATPSEVVASAPAPLSTPAPTTTADEPMTDAAP